MLQLNSIISKTISAIEKKKKSPKIRQIIMTNQLKNIFNEEAKKYYAQKNRFFNVDEKNKNYLNLLCKYFAQDVTFETVHKGELHKGIFAHGSHGTGKSSSFEILQSISSKYGLKNLWFPIVHTSTVVEKFNTEKNKDYVIQNYSRGIYCFDDLGAEIEGSNIYIFGKEDIFIRIMEARYNEFLTKGTKTHITSNLRIEDIKKRYGSRVEDRFVEMFNFLELGGNSRRF